MNPTYGYTIRRHVFVPSDLYEKHSSFFLSSITLGTGNKGLYTCASSDPVIIAGSLRKSSREGFGDGDTILGSLLQEYGDGYEKIVTEKTMQAIEELNRKIEESVRHIDGRIKFSFSVDGTTHTYAR